MKKFVSLFQKELGISERKAKIRVHSLLLILLCFIATIVLVLAIFPYKSSFDKEVKLSSGNYKILTEKTTDRVWLSNEQFDKISKLSDTIFLSTEYKFVTFNIKLNDVHFSSNVIKGSNSQFYTVAKINKVEGNEVALTICRDDIVMIVGLIIIPLVILFVCCLLAFWAQRQLVYEIPGRSGVKVAIAYVWL